MVSFFPKVRNDLFGGVLDVTMGLLQSNLSNHVSKYVPNPSFVIYYPQKVVLTQSWNITIIVCLFSAKIGTYLDVNNARIWTFGKMTVLDVLDGLRRFTTCFWWIVNHDFKLIYS